MVASTARAKRPTIAFPKPIDAAVYEEVRDAYLDRVFATGQVRGAYQMGGVGAPGLSDLDLILVCRDPLSAAVDQAVDIRSLGAIGCYVMMHSQFLVNEEVFRHQRALFWGSDLRHVRGETFDVVPLPADERGVLRLAFNVDMALRRLADFERLLATNDVIALRPLIAELHGIRFNIEFARDHADVADLEDYVAAVRHLRAHWFQLGRTQAEAWIMSLLSRAVEVLRALLDRLRPAAAGLHTGAPLCKGSVRTLEILETQRYGPWDTSVEVRPNPFRKAIPRPLRHRRSMRAHLAPIVDVRVPAEFFVFPALQARALRAFGRGDLAQRVRGELVGCAAPELGRAMRRRADVTVALLEFLASNRVRRSAYLMPTTWLRPYSWSYRIKARLLAATGMG